MDLQRKAAIVGIGATEFSRDSGRSERRLAVEAVLAALADAGVSADEVDGLVGSDYDDKNQLDIINALGLRNIASYATIPHGGGSPCGVTAHAAMMVASGVCQYVVAYRSLNERSGHRYGNPEVQNSNVVGRTALREAAATAWGAATTPGLSGDISAPMQSWSLRATKLLLVMGVHGGGNTLNDTATALNADAHNTQMACALAGTPAI